MASVSHEDAETVDGEVHENSWSANLELPEHADDRERVVADALDAVDRTAPGYHVNLVTHGDHGHPETYLYDELADAFGDDAAWEYVEQCGCGGHVTRVRVED
jgi:putative CGCGG family rSAM target protein